MRQKFRELHKIHEQLGVKFNESNEIFEISDHHNPTDYLSNPQIGLAGDEISSNFNERQQENSKSRMRFIRFNVDRRNPHTQRATRDSINTTDELNRAADKLKSQVIASTSRAPETMTRAASKPNMKFRSVTVVPQPNTQRTFQKSTRRGPRSMSADSMNRSEWILNERGFFANSTIQIFFLKNYEKKLIKYQISFQMLCKPDRSQAIL